MSGCDGTNSSTRVPICQVHVSACGYVLSCLALNGAASRGHGSSGTYPILENLQAWLQGAQVCTELGCKDKAG
jgi:hypothetical protein